MPRSQCRLILKRFGNRNNLKVFVVVVVVPTIMNTFQFVIQDTFLKKGDFEITDVEIMKKYYDCTEGEDLDSSLTKSGSDGSNNPSAAIAQKQLTTKQLV
jgi:STIMATE family